MDELGEIDRHRRLERAMGLAVQLGEIVNELEALHPGRRFPLDGHLVGSIGETAAEALFELCLQTASTAGHDAIAIDGRPVEIKATYGSRSVALRTTSHGAAAALIVLRLSRTLGLAHEIVYNGSLERVAHLTGRVQSNGQASLSLTRLRAVDAEVPESERIPRRMR